MPFAQTPDLTKTLKMSAVFTEEMNEIWNLFCSSSRFIAVLEIKKKQKNQ